MVIDPSTGVISWTPTVDQLGSQPVIVRVSDGIGNFASQSFAVVVAAGAPNRPPVATSLPPTDATVGIAINYTFNAVDPDGLPVIYSVTRGPAGLSIDPSSGIVSWTPTADDIGTVSVTLMAGDPLGGSAVQNFLVDVRAANRSPLITSIAPPTVPQGGLFRYDLQATDPDNEPLFYAIVNGPTGLTVDSLGRVRWQTAIDTPVSSQNVTVRVADGRGGSVTQTFDVNIVPDTNAPRISIVIGNPTLFPWSIQPARVRVSATDDVGVVGLRVTVDGSPVALRADNSFDVFYTGPGEGRIRAFATDAAGNEGTNAARVNMRSGNEDGSGNGASAPSVSITNIADGGEVGGFVQVVGSVTSPDLRDYTVSVRRADQDNFTVIATGTSQVVDGVLGTWDTTLLENDSYVLKVEATDLFGGFAAVERLVGVSGELKLGNFRLSFADIVVPVAGLPVTVARTYDTLQTNHVGDFGAGWRLEFRDTNLRTSLPQSPLQDIGLYTPFRSGVKVYLTLPGGKREGFTFTPDIRVLPSFGGTGLIIATPRFTADRGVTSTLSVRSGSLLVNEFGELSAAGGIPWNPASPDFGGYTLTTSDGIRYQIDGDTGLLNRATDRNGNTLRFSESGVDGPGDVGVTFERDALGRITAAIDPAGNAVRYAYSAAGDLVSVTDREGNITTFTYRSDRAHYLDSVTDPLGRTGVRADYGPDGRLSSLVNGAGEQTTISYDPNNQLVTTLDPLGNSTNTEYDSRGNVVAVTDALGGVTRTTYDNANNETSVTDPLGRVTRFEYDAAGNVTSVTDPTGAVTTKTYSRFGDVQTITNALGQTTTNSYDVAGNVLRVTDPLGNVGLVDYNAGGQIVRVTGADGTLFTVDTTRGLLNRLSAPTDSPVAVVYDVNGKAVSVSTGTGPQAITVGATRDAEGRLLTITDPLGAVTRYTYDAGGNKTSVTDPLGNVTRYTYDAANRLITTIDPDGGVTANQYDLAGRLVAIVERGNRETRYEYDALGRRTSTIYADDTPADPTDNPRTRTEYDAAGQAIAKIDELGRRTTTDYDLASRPTVITDPLGHATLTGYDAIGQVVSVTDPLGNVLRTEYDSAGRPTAIVAPDGGRERTTYDGRGRVASRTDAMGRTTRYAYDPLGRLAAVTTPTGDVTRYVYNDLGQLVTITDALGRVTRFEYDRAYRPTARVLPTGEREATTYDLAGRPVTQTDFAGGVTRFSFDSLNRLIRTDYPDGRAVVIDYAPTGEVASLTEGATATRYEYDARGRLLSKTDPDGQVVQYTYDAAGQKLTIASAAGIVAYEYDAAGRPIRTTDSVGGASTYNYDAANRLTLTTRPNGTTQTIIYDAVGRPIEQTDVGPGGVLSHWTFEYDAAGQRTAATDQTGRRTAYSYDLNSRLRSEVATGGGESDRTTTYTYDAAGNRRTRSDTIDGTTTYVYDARDQLLTEQTGSNTVVRTYDALGDELTVGSGPDDRTVFTWDASGRLVEAAVTTASGTATVRYTYTPDGERATRTENGITTRLITDTNREFAQVLAEVQGGVVTASYVRPATGLGLVSQTVNGTTVYPIAGPRGTVVAALDVGGTVTDRVSYDAFGQVLARTGTTPLGALFNGEPRDRLTGLDFLRARSYNPATGRFVSPDPFAGFLEQPDSLHKYLFAGNDPVNSYDPSGLITVTELLIGLTVTSLTTLLGVQQGRNFAEANNLDRTTGAIIGGITGFFIGFATSGVILTIGGTASSAAGVGTVTRANALLIPSAPAAFITTYTPAATVSTLPFQIVGGSLTFLSGSAIAYFLFSLYFDEGIRQNGGNGPPPAGNPSP